MNIPWEYLRKEDFDPRIMAIAGYLTHRVAGKNIVDLDAGHAPLLHYIPDTFRWYYANDKFLNPAEFHDPRDLTTMFHQCTDLEAEAYLKDKKVDILCAIGMGAGHVHPVEWESPELDAVVERMVERHQPEIVVLENTWEYSQRFGLIDSLAHRMRGYKIVQRFKIETLISTEKTWAPREVAILEK